MNGDNFKDDLSNVEEISSEVVSQEIVLEEADLEDTVSAEEVSVENSEVEVEILEISEEVGNLENVEVIGANEKTRRPGKGFSLEKRRAIAGYLFVLPFILGFLFFLLYPLGMSFQWSMASTDSGVRTINGKGVFDIVRYVGFSNYGKIISEDYDFSKNFLLTIERTFLWTPFIIVFSLFIAIMLNRKIRFRGVFRVIYFLPVLLGTGLVLQKLSDVTQMLTIPQGLTNLIQYIVSNESVETFIRDLLQSIINMFWKMGVQIIIFLAGLQSIPESYYEAARVDSANWWDMLWKITIPMLSPMILLNVVYSIIDSFRDSSNPIVEYILKQYGYANWVEVSTMGWMYFAVTLIMLGVVFLATRRFIFYEK